MQQKKINLGKVLMTILVITFLGFMIWFFVDLSADHGVSWDRTNVINKDSEITLNYEVLSVKEEYNDQIVTVSGYYHSNPTEDLSQTSVRPYTFTWYKSDYKTVEYTISKQSYLGSKEVSLIGEKTTVSEYFSKSVSYAKEQYIGNTFFKNNNNILGTVKVQNYEPNYFLAYLPNILFIILLLVAGYFLMRSLSGSVSSSNKTALDFNKSRARKVKSNIKFTDVAGCEEEKAEMVELVDYLKNPSKYKACGAKLPKGVLLVGAPGTGKTLLAKAVAGEANVPFYSISGSDFVEMFVGVGAGRVRDMFREAKQNAPCLIFIDEIDAVGRQRGTGMGGGNDEREQTLNQLLVEMDGFDENAGILVIAATNRDDVLDPALLRAGRFDRKITVSVPDLKGREAIFKVHAKNKKIDPSVNFEALAKRTVGFTGADIATILNDAAILTVRYNVPAITTDIIDEAIDRRIAGPAKSSHTISDEEKRRIAFHEAGHAVLGIRFPNSDKVQRITIIPRGDTGGHVLITPEQDRYNYTKKQLIARIVSYLGGRTSEEIFFDDVSTGAYEDIEVATQIARSMVVEYGMSSLGPIQYEKPSGNVFLGRDYTSSSRNFSSDVAKEIDREIRKIIDEAHESAREYLTKYEDDVKLIANTLLDKETITAEQIEYLLTKRTLDGFQKSAFSVSQPVTSNSETSSESDSASQETTTDSNATSEENKPNDGSSKDGNEEK